jgi:UDPglucose 6-dehydrogenase
MNVNIVRVPSKTETVRKPASGDASPKTKIAVVGSGYVGLVAGACFAEVGHEVVCVDNDQAKIDRLNQGIVPIFEPGLSELIVANSASGRLTFTLDLRAALDGAQAVFIAVGTPPRPVDGHPDMKHVYAVAKAIAENASGDLVVVGKSTVPVGTGDRIEDIINRINPQLRVAVVSNPEFLREGAAIADFMTPERVVIGADEQWAQDIVSGIYSAEGFGDAPKVITSRRSAELLKYAANAFLAMKITFINEIADLCESVDADIGQIAYGMGLDSRIGAKFLKVGPGYGGSCFPKDAFALAKTARDHRVQLRTVEAVIEVNNNRKRAMALKILDACGGSVIGRRIAVLGLAFKADTDDVRESPAVPIIQALQDFGADISAYDPEAMPNCRALLSNVDLCSDAYQAARGADAVVVITEWAEFKTLDLAKLRSVMNRPVLVDLRNLYSHEEVRAAGVEYWSVGRRPVQGDVDLAMTQVAAE